jgi:hypothetical protein
MKTPDFPKVIKKGNALVKIYEITLKDNALRHPFVSYRVAAIKNVPQVAYESGNSPQIIHSNYLELVVDADVQRWFAITRPKPRRVVGLRQTGFGARGDANGSTNFQQPQTVIRPVHTSQKDPE